MDKIRKVVARRLTESKQNVPHFYLRMQVGVDALLALRKTANLVLGAKASINDYLVRAVAVALAKHGDVNIQVHGDAIHHFAHADIAIAVASPKGLVTPIVRSADLMRIDQIAAATKALIDKAQAGKLGYQDLDGGTFSISNLGMFVIDQFAAGRDRRRRRDQPRLERSQGRHWPLRKPDRARAVVRSPRDRRRGRRQLHGEPQGVDRGARRPFLNAAPPLAITRGAQCSALGSLGRACRDDWCGIEIIGANFAHLAIAKAVEFAQMRGRERRIGETERQDCHRMVDADGRFDNVEPRDVHHPHHLGVEFAQRGLARINARHRQRIGFSDKEVIGQQSFGRVKIADARRGIKLVDQFKNFGLRHRHSPMICATLSAVRAPRTYC